MIKGSKLSSFVGITYVSTQVVLFESKIRCQMLTLLLNDYRSFIINPYIAARTLPPNFLIANIHSIRYPHTLSPLNDDG